MLDIQNTQWGLGWQGVRCDQTYIRCQEQMVNCEKFGSRPFPVFRARLSGTFESGLCMLALMSGEATDRAIH